MSDERGSVSRSVARVLLVDDDIDTRGMYRLALELQGFAVLDAANATTALSSALEGQPDVVVTDLGLPGGEDGVGLARGLRDHPRTARIPVLAVTGRDPRALGPAAALFDAVLLKPVSPDLLVKRIRETLRPPTGPSRTSP